MNERDLKRYEEVIHNVRDIIDIFASLGEKNYQALIIGLLCYDRQINPTMKNIEKLINIENKWFDSDYMLLNDCFTDYEYELLNEDEHKLMNEGDEENE